MNRGYVDKVVIVVVLILALVGLIAVYSSTSALATVKAKYSEKSGLLFVQKQLFTLALGISLMLLFLFIPAQKLKKLVFPLLALSFILLVLVFTPLGVSAGGAKRWIKLWPSQFQPSELVKLSMVFFLAWYLSRADFRRDRLKDFLIPVGLMGLFQIIFLKQPDFGAAMTLGIITMIMLFVGGVSLRLISMSIILALPVLVYLLKEPYRLRRITSFIDPWADPQGSGFQLIQSLIALGSGGLTGQGLGEGRQKLAFLPEIHTDFIFAQIGEELGFLGAISVVVLFLILALRGLKIAQSQSEPFCFYLAFGCTAMITIQALINFAVVTGLAPTKGLPLPFVSYGGSSLVVNLIAVGVLLNLSRNRSDFTRGEAFSAKDKVERGSIVEKYYYQSRISRFRVSQSRK